MFLPLSFASVSAKMNAIRVVWNLFKMGLSSDPFLIPFMLMAEMGATLRV